ncbi:MAG: HAMP domain-containing sensor histidine kinase [Comamonas sp.]
MRLATFLETAHVQILDEAVAFARTIPALQHTGEKALRDHLPQVLKAISADLRTSQSRTEAIAKSHGDGPEAASQTSAEIHGLTRAQEGIDIEQLVAEFRALRSSILRLWAEKHVMQPNAIEDIMRFNEAIDQAVAESVKFYAEERERWREIFLGVLGHDLRGPLNTISLTTAVLRQQGIAPVQQTAMLTRGVARMKSLLDTLLEYSRSSLGMGMALQLAPVDLAVACADELELQCAAHPAARVDYVARGPTQGAFDESWVREALGNLVSNAIKHGDAGEPITVTLEGHAAGVRICVENAGVLPPDDIDKLFEPLRQGKSDSAQKDRTHLGLGLFIVRQVARAHGGDVTGSCSDRRVRFTMELPKQ